MVNKPILRSILDRNDLPPGLILNLTQANSEAYEVECPWLHDGHKPEIPCPYCSNGERDTGTRRVYVGGCVEVETGNYYLNKEYECRFMMTTDGAIEITLMDEDYKKGILLNTKFIDAISEAFRNHALPLSLLHPSAGGTCEWGLRECEVCDD